MNSGLASELSQIKRLMEKESTEEPPPDQDHEVEEKNKKQQKSTNVKHAQSLIEHPIPLLEEIKDGSPRGAARSAKDE